jgi:hypothetical protein
MESLPVAIVIVCGGGLILTALITSFLLGREILEPRPKRDITINANIWPLTLPESSFTEHGKKIRKAALRTVILLLIVAVATLVCMGLYVWLS